MKPGDRVCFVPGSVLEVERLGVTERHTFHAGSKLTVEWLSGAWAGQSERVAYEAQFVQPSVSTVGFRLGNGTEVVHVLYLDVGRTSSALTPPIGVRDLGGGTIVRSPGDPRAYDGDS